MNELLCKRYFGRQIFFIKHVKDISRNISVRRSEMLAETREVNDHIKSELDVTYRSNKLM